MIRTALKTFAYAKAPRTTFVMLHPRQALKLKRLRRDMRHAYAPRLAALGTLALALPLGYALGRMTANGRNGEA